MTNKVLIEFRLDDKPVVGFIYERGTLNAMVILCYMIKLIEDKLYRPDLINAVLEKFYTKGNVEVSIANNIINYTLSPEDLYINKDLAFRYGNYDTIPDNIQKLICHIDTEVIITENIITEVDSDDLELYDIEELRNLDTETDWYRGCRLPSRLLLVYASIFRYLEEPFIFNDKIYRFRKGE